MVIMQTMEHPLDGNTVYTLRHQDGRQYNEGQWIDPKCVLKKRSYDVLLNGSTTVSVRNESTSSSSPKHVRNNGVNWEVYSIAKGEDTTDDSPDRTRP